MVLQNKYKARASAKHNRGRGGSSGRGRGRGRGRGQLHHDDPAWANEAEGEGASGDDSDASHEEEDAEFPSLVKAAGQAPELTDEQLEQEEEQRRERAKYSRRKIESNAWRFEQMRRELERDPDEEPEPEVDISALVERVKLLDSSKDVKPGAALGDPEADEEERRRVEADIDHSLAYLSERERKRQAAKGNVEAPAKVGGVKKLELTAEEQAQEAAEREEMLQEKEKAEALRALKERFQGHAIGERQTKSRAVRLNAGNSASAVLDPVSARAEGGKAEGKTPGADEEKPKTQVESMQDFLDGMLG